MKWDYWFQLFVQRHCPARGLRPSTIIAYETSLKRFRIWVELRLGKEREPDEITTKDILEFVTYLRKERANGDSAVNSQVVTLLSFYRTMVALEQLEHRKNPMNNFPKIKAPKRKIRDTLSIEEAERLVMCPPANTVLGLRDRAILVLLYGTGIRASECAHVLESDVDLLERTVRVIGKGGYQRVVPLNASVVLALEAYRKARGEAAPEKPFFRSRNSRGASRAIIYDRVKRFARLARIMKHVSPHVLRHTFATQLVRAGQKLVHIRDLLGHRCLTSTQIYFHTTGEELRSAVDRHPVGKLLESLGKYLPDGKLPFQYPQGRRFALNNR
jgi:site-specific recombinase XerD